MRILYGVQTTGRGHVVRSRAMIAALKARGVTVDTLLSGPPLDARWRDPVFEPAVERHGLTFVTDHGRIRYLATARQLRPGRYLADVVGHRPRDYDLVVTDYEPICAWFARLRGLPSVGIGHLYAFAHRSVPVAGRNALNKAVMRWFAPARSPIGLHWHHFDAPVLPPTIPEEVRRPTGTDESLVVVYMGFEAPEAVARMLRPIDSHRFRIYCHVDAPRDEGHLEFRPLERTAFARDLTGCGGVICNAGFSLVSEALHLGKRVLAKAVAHQTEQESNVLALERLGYGHVLRRLDTAAVRGWLGEPMPTPLDFPDTMPMLADWIAAGCPGRAEDLIEGAWERGPDTRRRPDAPAVSWSRPLTSESPSGTR